MWFIDCSYECVDSLFNTCFSHQTSCLQNLMAPGLSGIVRSYTLSVNKRTVEQEYICTKDSEQCSYAWNVSANEATNYMVSVAANNVVGQSVTKNCTTTPIGEQLLVTGLVQSICMLYQECVMLSFYIAEERRKAYNFLFWPW